MGTTTSTPQQEKERRQRQLMETLGVLVPPSFGVGTNERLPPSAISMSRPSPSFLYSLERNSTCFRILHQHLSSGLWVSASTPSQASVLAAFYVKQDDGNHNEGLLSVSQSFPPTNKNKASIRAYTSGASVVSAEYSPVSYIHMVGNVNAKGMGWIGCNVNAIEWFREKTAAARKRSQQAQYYRNNPFADDTSQDSFNAIQNLQFGTSVILQQQQASSNTTRIAASSSPVQVKSVLGHASMQVAACTVATEAQVPMDETLLDPQVSLHVSANLNTKQQGPPLIVTMTNTPEKSIMNLSQVLTFDRIVMNALETRCPRIRNTFGWAVQMEKYKDEDAAQLVAGLAWQINRGVAVKIVAKSNSGVVTGALVLKRWKQPRVLCSLLAGTTCAGKNVHLGIGLELETLPAHAQQDYYNETEERLVDDATPETKATLPDIGVTVNNNN